MSLQFPDEAKKQATASLQRYCAEELDVELTGIQAAMLLDFVLAEIAPSESLRSRLRVEDAMAVRSRSSNGSPA